MITAAERHNLAREALARLGRAGVVVAPSDAERIEIADFGLGRPLEVGLQLLVYINTARCCAKELVLLPRQLCPEHRHPPLDGNPGKEETFRCRRGEVYLYLPGDPTQSPRAAPAADIREHLTVWREVILTAGMQATITPGTLHWFQAGDDGAVVSEFSTTSIDEADIFTDPRVLRTTVIADG